MTSLVPYEDPSEFRKWLERPGVSVDRVKREASAIAVHGPRKLLLAPLLLLAELKPICRGLGRVLVGWSRWCAVADYAETISHAEGSDRARHQEKVEHRRSGRRRLSLILALILIGVGWWCAVKHVEYLIGAGVVLLAILDLIGRRGTEKEEPLPQTPRAVLRDNVPLRQITATLIDTALREGLEFTVASPMYYDTNRREYRISIGCLDEIKPEHLRALERGIGATDHSMRSLATDTATVRELVIRDGDPLAEVVSAPWIETGSVSVSDPLDLGVSMTEVPFALAFAGQHFKVVGATGSGKSAWFLRNCIDRVSACRNAAILGIDLHGMELDLWRGVIQKKGRTPEEAASLLKEVLGEIERRTAILREYAEDDDPANDHLTEWCEELAEREGPAWVVFIDEYHLVAAIPELLEMCQEIVRLGRKVWISLIMLSQKVGNTDFGSTVMTSQANTTIALPCSPDDSVRLFGKDKRDAGWCPHLLRPGTKEERRDAGKGYVESPAHTTPDIYSCYAPLSAGEVKARARRRLADGIPSMYVGRDAEVLEAAEVPPLLAAVEQVFAEAGFPEWIATRDLLTALREEFPDLSEMQLAAGVPVSRDEPGSRRRLPGGKHAVRGYLYESIRRAMESL